MRSCGDCTECCTVMGHDLSEKRVRCEHEQRRGCGIYDTRPTVCRTFRCAWLAGKLPRKDRPDLSGLIVAFEDTGAGMTLMAYETRSGAHRRGRGASLMQRLVSMAGERMPAILKLADGHSRPMNARTASWMAGIAAKGGA